MALRTHRRWLVEVNEPFCTFWTSYAQLRRSLRRAGEEIPFPADPRGREMQAISSFNCASLAVSTMPEKTGETSPLDGKRVIIVEDEAATVLGLGKSLARVGVSVMA